MLGPYDRLRLRRKGGTPRLADLAVRILTDRLRTPWPFGQVAAPALSERLGRTVLATRFRCAATALASKCIAWTDALPTPGETLWKVDSMTEKDPQAQDAVQPQDVTSEQVVEDTLVEDVSIDGMCGVY